MEDCCWCCYTYTGGACWSNDDRSDLTEDWIGVNWLEQHI